MWSNQTLPEISHSGFDSDLWGIPSWTGDDWRWLAANDRSLVPCKKSMQNMWRSFYQFYKEWGALNPTRHLSSLQVLIEGSLEVKLPTIWADGKAEVGRVREEKKQEDQRKGQKKEDAGARKGRKVAIHYVFPMIFGSSGSKSRLARLVRSHLVGWEMKNCTLLWRGAHFEIKMVKAPHVRTTIGSWDAQKAHSVRVGPLLEVEMSKKCTPLWREALSKSKC